MAQAPKAATAGELSLRVKEATQAATENVLRLAAGASEASNGAEDVAIIAGLAQLCEQAAAHMAKAQTFMFEGEDGGEAAIEQLDAALLCLNRLAEEDGRHKAAQNQTAKSA